VADQAASTSTQPSTRELTRRTLLRWGLLGAAGIAGLRNRPVVAQSVTRTAPAKALIQIWMWGGPAHLDTFDPKPKAGYDYCGPLDKPIPTNVDGIQIGELLPQLAQQADKYSIIRSMTHGVNAHETAAYLVQTGRKPGRLVYPGVGAVVSLFKGYDHGYAGIVPPYIVLTEPQDVSRRPASSGTATSRSPPRRSESAALRGRGHHRAGDLGRAPASPARSAAGARYAGRGPARSSRVRAFRPMRPRRLWPAVRRSAPAF
jgi:hypothetical protein